jgi:hypothetical protein
MLALRIAKGSLIGSHHIIPWPGGLEIFEWSNKLVARVALQNAEPSRECRREHRGTYSLVAWRPICV